MPLRKPAVAGFFVGGESEGFPRLTSPVFMPPGGTETHIPHIKKLPAGSFGYGKGGIRY